MKDLVSTIMYPGVVTESHITHANLYEKNLEKVFALLEQAAFDKPDIVCLPETFASLGLI